MFVRNLWGEGSKRCRGVGVAVCFWLSCTRCMIESRLPGQGFGRWMLNRPWHGRNRSWQMRCVYRQGVLARFQDQGSLDVFFGCFGRSPGTSNRPMRYGDTALQIMHLGNHHLQLLGFLFRLPTHFHPRTAPMERVSVKRRVR